MSFDIDVSIRRGDRTICLAFSIDHGVTALFGHSGVGKTTVLNMIAGLLKPDEGHIIIGGETLFDKHKNLPPEQRRCGYIFQDGRLFPHLSVRANLLYGAKRVTPENALMGFDDCIAFLGIGDLLERRPLTLSGGEAQRVAIGRALLSGPRFLAMDEPLSSLDAARREEIMRVIERIRDELKLPILYVSHDRAEVERLAGNIVTMD